MFRTVDRYIARETLVPFALALVVFTFLLMMEPLSAHAEKLIAKGVSAKIVAWAMINLIPQALGITIPIAFLLALLMAFGRLSGDREWVALQACGVSIFRLLRPVMALGVLAGGATLWVMIWAIPEGNQTFREIVFNVLAERAEGEVRPRVFYTDFPDLVLYARDVQTARAGWSEVFVADSSQPGPPVIYVADRGRLLLDRSAQRVELILERGNRHTVTPAPDAGSPEKYEISRFERLVLTLDPETVFPRSGPQKGDQERTITELRAHIEELKRQGVSTHNAVMAIQRKFSIPAACLVFAVMGLALGASSSRSGRLAGFVLGLGVVFAYYIVMYTTESLAKAHHLAPEIAPWTPNVVLGLVAIVLLGLRRRGTEGFLQITLPFPARPPAAEQASTATADRRVRGRVVLVIRLPRFEVPRPGIIDRYISRQFLRFLLLTGVSLLGIFYIAAFIDLSDKLFKGQATVRMLLDYFWYQTPEYLYYAIPIAVLIACLVTVGALTKNSELVVMKACGISLYRVSFPLLLLALLASGVLFVIQEHVLPLSSRRAHQLNHVMRGGSPATFDLLNRRWLVSKDGAIYHYVYFDPRQQVLDNLSVYEFHPRRWGLSRRTSVTRAMYRAGEWHATQGWVREFSVTGEARSWAPFVDRALALEPPDYFGTERPSWTEMTYGQLRRHVDELAASGINVIPLTVRLHRKAAFPLVTVVIALLGVPFAVTTGRRGALYGIGVGIVLAITYWITGNVFSAIGSGGALPPALSAWAPNILFGGAAGYLLLTVRT